MCVSLLSCALLPDLLLWTPILPTHLCFLPPWQMRCYLVGAAGSNFPGVSPVSCSHRLACLSLPFGESSTLDGQTESGPYSQPGFPGFPHVSNKKKERAFGSHTRWLVHSRDVIWFGYGHGHMLTSVKLERLCDAEFTLPLWQLQEADNSRYSGSASWPPQILCMNTAF